MGKKKTKGKPPPTLSEEYGRFRDLLRRLVAVPRKEIEEKLEEYHEQRKEKEAELEPDT